jgi:glutathione-regulated potassium-efflux system ancillary protein KefC
MALTPILIIVHDRALARRQTRKADAADEVSDEHAPVIIAGFGRFGQIVGRLLFANGVRATVLDRDPDQIELLRRFDFRIYYGDATRLDLLQAAGAARAKLLVVAIDDVEASLRLVDAVREHFPALMLVARARNLAHWQELRSRGVPVVERELFEAAVKAGRRSLELLGMSPYEARERSDYFRRHNVKAMEDILPHWHDERLRTSMARSAREQLERQMRLDRDRIEGHAAQGWQAELDPNDADRQPPRERAQSPHRVE